MELTVTAVQSKIDAGVAWITLTQPHTGNALNPALIQELDMAIQTAIAEPTCRAVVLSAAGSDFCKGMDLEALTQHSTIDITLVQPFLDCLNRIAEAPLPVIACVEGNVSGGGLGLIAACDVVLASPAATFVLPEVIIGMIPAVIAPFLLRRLTPAKLNYLTVSSQTIDSSTAQAIGLVDEVATESMALTVTRQLQRLFRSSPDAIAQWKQYCSQLNGDRFQQQTDLAIHQLVAWLNHPDVLANIQTFNEGFSPPWFQKYRGKHHG